MGRVEFFEPLTSTSPINLSPPRMTILSISKPQTQNPNIVFRISCFEFFTYAVPSPLSLYPIGLERNQVLKNILLPQSAQKRVDLGPALFPIVAILLPADKKESG